MGVTSSSMGGMKIMRRTRMVNDVPMETIYNGMSRNRVKKLMSLFDDAIGNVESKHWSSLTTMTDNQYYDLVDSEFRYLCQRAAVKAGWHSKKRKATINKKKVAA